MKSVAMDGQQDSESYWNRSTSKGFSFDDDHEDGGGLAGSVSGLSLSSLPGAGGDILNDDAISEASFDNSLAGSTLNLSLKALISDEAIQSILYEQSLDDRVLSKGMAADEELKLLRRQIQTTLYNPSPTATAHKLLLGKTVHFEVFKSLHEKEQLLDAVLQQGGGDGVIGVLLFLKKSLNRANFHKILQQRPRAFQHYVSFLQDRQHHQEAAELLQAFGRSHEVALLQFQTACAVQDLTQRKERIRHLMECYGAAGGAVISLYQQLFHSTHKLLELVEKERNALDNRVDIQSTPVEVLYACCAKHTNWKDHDMLRSISPFRLCAEQTISAAQFEWTALNERATAQAYADLESVFERVPTWHPMKQKQFHISFPLEVAVQRLHELRSPTAVLYHFLSKMSDARERLDWAQRTKCTKAVIDALAALKEVTQLTQLRDTLPDRSEEQFHCDKALKSMQTKRWSTDNIKLKL